MTLEIPLIVFHTDIFQLNQVSVNFFSLAFDFPIIFQILSWVYLLFKSALLRYNLYATEFTWCTLTGIWAYKITTLFLIENISITAEKVPNTL